MTVFGGDVTFANDVNNLDRVRWVAGTGIVANSATITTTETVVITTPTFTYKAGRAYKILVTGSIACAIVSGTPALSPLFRLRKTNAGGQQFDTFRVAVLSAGVTHGAHYACYFKVGAADVGAAIALTLTGTANFSTTMNAAATSPSSLNVYEVGAAGDFSWAPTLV